MRLTRESQGRNLDSPGRAQEKRPGKAQREPRESSGKGQGKARESPGSGCHTHH